MHEDNSAVGPCSFQSRWAHGLLDCCTAGWAGLPACRTYRPSPKHPALIPNKQSQSLQQSSGVSLSSFSPLCVMPGVCQLLCLYRGFPHPGPHPALADTSQQQHPALQPSLTSSSNAFPVQLRWGYFSSIHADMCLGAHTFLPPIFLSVSTVFRFQAHPPQYEISASNFHLLSSSYFSISVSTLQLLLPLATTSPLLYPYFSSISVFLWRFGHLSPQG